MNISAAVAAAASLELMHCASLVHDDLPCFDDAETRRGLPSVHAAFGQPIAVLAGDALIVAAFEAIAAAEDVPAPMALGLTRVLARAAGSPLGIAAGQAWESESQIDLEAYQRAKTGALFVAACEAGAVAGSHTPGAWTRFGDELGLAYQAADDLRDTLCSSGEMGKPAGRDIHLHRPSIVADRGVSGAAARLEILVTKAKDAIPACPGRSALRGLVDVEMARLMPREILERAA
jgi:geranylgeranyl diphosphate synthase, type II